MAVRLSTDQVVEVLREVVEGLAELGGEASVFVFGGAAIALLNPCREAAYDIDGWIGKPVDPIEVIARVQAKHGLEGEWFNFAPNGLLPPVAGTDMFEPWLTVDRVTLYSATADALLAMKLRVARGKDFDDIVFLLDYCDITTVNQADFVLGRHYPGDALSEVAIARVEAALAR